MKLSLSITALFLAHIAAVNGYPVMRHERSIALESRYIDDAPLMELSARYAPDYSDEITARGWSTWMAAAKTHYNTYMAGKKATPPAGGHPHDQHTGHPQPAGEHLGQHEHLNQHEHSPHHPPPHDPFAAGQHQHGFGGPHEHNMQHEHMQHEYGGQHQYGGAPPGHMPGSYHQHPHEQWR